MLMAMAFSLNYKVRFMMLVNDRVIKAIKCIGQHVTPVVKTLRGKDTATFETSDGSLYRFWVSRKGTLHVTAIDVNCEVIDLS